MTTSNTPRRSEEDLRNEHLEAGALLLQFHFKEPVNRRLCLLWAAVEKTGFLVTSEGCLLPHTVHSKKPHAAREIACEIAHGSPGEELHSCNPSCCNPSHVLSSEVCSTAREHEYLRYSDANLSKTVDALFRSFARVVVLPCTHYRVADEKRRNRLLRRKREKRQIQQQKEKRRRGISKQ